MVICRRWSENACQAFEQRPEGSEGEYHENISENSIQKAKRTSCTKELDVFEEYQGDQGGCNEVREENRK